MWGRDGGGNGSVGKVGDDDKGWGRSKRSAAMGIQLVTE